jgi:predicted methyltransferase
MRSIRPLSLLLWLLIWGGVTAVDAQNTTVAPRTRTPAGVMSFRGAEWLERPQRASEERPGEVLDVMRLGPGDVVADLGAGSGYFTRLMAPLVTPGGTVFAVDVQPEMLDLLMESVQQEGVSGVVPVLSEPDDPRLPRGEVDWILMVDVYHELANPQTMLARMREALAPAGRVALVEYRVEDGSGDHIRAEHRMSVRQVVTEWEAGGFRLVDLYEFLPSQHLFILRAEGGAGPAVQPVLPHYDLAEALRSGSVELTVAGTGEDALTLTIRRTRAERMVVTLPAGAWFESEGAAGDMIARRDAFVLLDQDGARAWRVPARRAQGAAPVPRPADRLQLLADERGAAVRDLMWVFQGIDLYPAIAPTVEQIAVWIVVEDLGWEPLSAHARVSSVHAANAVALAAAYVNGSGIDIRQKRIWAERERFVADLTDEGLRRIFAELGGN